MKESIALGGDARLYLDDLQFEAIRASGPGGQHVNKVATAVQLRLDLHRARLPQALRERLLASRDRRISGDGVLTIKAQRHRSQARNRDEALQRLLMLLREAGRPRVARRVTKPGPAARRKRLDQKNINSKVKQLRKKPPVD